MPAAAVIPAPIAYIKVVAVKKLVVEFLRGCDPSASRRCAVRGTSRSLASVLHWASSSAVFT